MAIDHPHLELLVERLEIAGIPTGIVDPHHHVLPFWLHHLRGTPAHLLHIDAHNDISGVPVGKNLFGEGAIPPRDEKELCAYTVCYVHEGNFICPADVLGLLDSIYYFNPRRKDIVVFRDRLEPEKKLKRIRGKVGTIYVGWEDGESQIFDQPGLPRYQITDYAWRFPKGFLRRSQRTIIERINNSSDIPLLVDIDLDAFECAREPNEQGLDEKTYRRRLQRTFAILRRLHKPALFNLVRGQTSDRTPIANECYRQGAKNDFGKPYVPPGRVDAIQQDVLAGLRQVYEKKT